jgi:hypothetical protein
MLQYKFRFLSRTGEPLQETGIDAEDDAQALEFARLLKHQFAIQVCQDDRDIGLVWREVMERKIS